MITDLSTHAIPAPVALVAGVPFTDPTFGSTILRCTDAADGTGCGTIYSYWPSFSKNATWLIAAGSHAVSTWTEPLATLLGWASGKITSRKHLDMMATKNHLDVGSGIWSGLDDDSIWIPKQSALYTYNVRTGIDALVKDFTLLLPGEYQQQWHRSLDDDLFSFTRQNHAYQKIGYAVWRRSTDTLVYKADTPNIDEVQLDKSGRYLTVKTGHSGQGVIEGQVVDLQTAVVADITDNPPGDNLGHSDNGTAIQVGEEDWLGGIWMRGLANPLNPMIHLLDGAASGVQIGISGHYSMLMDGDSWCLFSTHDPLKFGMPIGGELVMVRTDGSKQIRRLCHHQASCGNYWALPRPNISRDGRWVAFTSSFGCSRSDLYVVATGILPGGLPSTGPAAGTMMYLAPDGGIYSRALPSGEWKPI